MSSLSSLQAAKLDSFRKENPGPIGVILEDDQGYVPLVRHLTGEPVRDQGQFADLAARKVARCVNGGGNGPPEKVNLDETARAYRWCFIFFQATFGRDDIAEQIDQLLDRGQTLDRLVLANYHLDHSEAKDDLRRLFGLVATVDLCFADEQHLCEIGKDETANARGAKMVARLFAGLRKASLPAVATTYREYLRTIEGLGSQESPKDVANLVRGQLAEATGMLFQLGIPGLPTKKEFDRSVEAVIKSFMANPGS